MKSFTVGLFGLALIASSSAQPVVLRDGAYELMRARIDGDETGDPPRSTVVVNISIRHGKAYMVLEGAEAEIQTDAHRGFVVSLPYHPERKNRWASQIVFGGLAVPTRGGFTERVKGFYHIIWSSEGEKGEFILSRVSGKAG